MRKIAQLMDAMSKISLLRYLGRNTKQAETNQASFRYKPWHYNLDGTIRQIRFRFGQFLGPAFMPAGEWAHEPSRQIRRAALRTICFAQITQSFPGESRRTRRRIARARAANQYRAAMASLTAPEVA